MVGETILWIAGVSLVVLMPFCLVTVWSFDRLVKRLHDQANKDWRELGRPCGYFYFPPEGRVLARSWSGWVWLFKTPACIEKDLVALKLLRRRRMSFWVWNLGFLCVVALYALFVYLNSGA